MNILTLTSFLKQNHPCQLFCYDSMFVLLWMWMYLCMWVRSSLGVFLQIVLGLQGWFRGTALMQEQSLFSGSFLMKYYSQVKRKNVFLLLKR